MLITSHHWRNVFGSLPALRMAQGPQRRSLALSGARLLGRLACDGFQTLLVLMMLSAGQQKGHPSSWLGLPLRRGRSSWMVRVRSECRCVRRAEIEEARDDGKWRPLALPKFR